MRGHLLIKNTARLDDLLGHKVRIEIPPFGLRN